MSADYRNLIITKGRVNWTEIKLYNKNVHNVYKMKIKHAYVYFVRTTGQHALDEVYLHNYKMNTILICQNDCDSFIRLLDYTKSGVREVDTISDDFIYDDQLSGFELEDAEDAFIELLDGSVLKVDKHIELSDEELDIMATTFKCLFEQDEWPDYVKYRVTEVC